MAGENASGLARWHAIRVMGGCERKVARHLERAGVMFYLPQIDRLIVVKSARRLYTRVMQWPMQPGLMFIYSLGLDWRKVLNVPGVQGTVGPRRRTAWGDGLESGEPFVVPDSFIQQLLDIEIGEAVARAAQAERQVKSLMPKEEHEKRSRKPGRRGRRAWRKRRGK